jgi:hypothetical protein
MLVCPTWDADGCHLDIGVVDVKRIRHQPEGTVQGIAF